MLWQSVLKSTANVVEIIFYKDAAETHCNQWLPGPTSIFKMLK